MSWRLTTFAVAIALAVWAGLPRRPDLAQFDPNRTADAETAMWRDYYDHQYGGLFLHLYALNRDEFGFSPWDSFMLAFDAADAARRFQPTRSRAEAQTALPALTRYYSRMAKGVGAPFDAAAAASRELDWWQARREDVSPEDYGKTIAAVSGILYGRDAPKFEAAGVLRAEAMAYRDARSERMQEEDWRAIADQLRLSYRALKATLLDEALSKVSTDGQTAR